MFNAEKELHLVKLRTSGKGSGSVGTTRLRIEGAPGVAADLAGFAQIEFSKDGRRLLLSSSTAVGIVEIPKNVILDGEIDASKLLNHACQFEYVLQNCGTVVKATFHSLSDYHIVALVKDNASSSSLQVISILSPKGSPPNSIPLGSTDFVGFCFGNEYDWSFLTVFLLTKQGAVYFLCPVLPEGAIVPVTAVDALWLWLRETQNKAPQIEIFLNAAFASPPSSSASTAFVRSGQGFSSSWRSDVAAKQYQSLFEAEPYLQGPLAGIATSTSRGAGVSAVDICSPQMPRGAPVLIISYSNGSVSYAMPTPDDAASFVSPCWTMVATANRPAPPKMAIVETVSLVVAGEEPSKLLRLLPDPVRGEYLHATDEAMGRVYLMQSGLLSSALMGSAAGRDNALVQSDCIPLYAPNSNPTPLVGMSVVSDPLVGHLALFRPSSGPLVAVNLHAHMHRMQSKMADALAFQEPTDDERLSFLSTAEALTDEIQAGLDSCPVPEEAENSSVRVNAAVLNKATHLATKHLEEKVVAGLEQYAYRIIMLLDSLKQKHDKQQGDVEAARTKLQSQLRRQGELEARVTSTLDALAARKERATRALRALSAQGQAQTKPCEEALEQELGEWMCRAARMEARIKVGSFLPSFFLSLETFAPL